MAKTQTVEEHAELRDRLDPPTSMPPAPEGSAQRVSDDDLLPFDADEPDSVVSPEAKDGSILVNDYDANGEAIARQVPIEGQPEMPGMPEKHPGLWPDYQGERVAEVHVSFSGDHDLNRGDATAVGSRGRRISGTFEGVVQGHSYKPRKKGGGLIGAATIVIDSVSFGERDAAADSYAWDEDRMEILEVADVIDKWAHGEAGAEFAEMEAALARLREIAGYEERDDDDPSALDASLAEALAE